jgi:hypothetical protein
MPATYTLISSNVLTSSQASVTFSAIPSTYTDLVIRFSVRTDQSDTQDSLALKFNGDSSALYSIVALRGNGATATSFLSSGATSINTGQVDGDTATANTFSSTEIYIPSYTASQSKPSSTFFAQENNITTAFIGAYANLYRSNTAISSIAFTPNGGTNFLSTSSFYLYGISNA